MVAIDPVVAIADGRAAFRADDLLLLARLLTEFEPADCK